MKRALLVLVVGCSSPSHPAPVIDGAPAVTDAAIDASIDAMPDAPIVAGFTIEPPAITLAVGGDQYFVAVGGGPVVWTSDGGTIDPIGKFVAGSAPAIVHVTATSLADGTTATATATVVDQQLVLLAGAIDGPGNLDGIGAAARFETSSGTLASDVAGNALYFTSSAGSIRRIDLATNAVTTVATNLGLPHLLGFDPVARVLYFNGRYTVERFDPATGVVDVLAGQSAVGGMTDGPGAAATFTAPASGCIVGRTLYVIERAEVGGVRTIDLAAPTHDVATLAAMTEPNALACTPSLLYVGTGTVNAAGTRISTVDVATGTVAPFAFGPALISNVPTALAIANGGATLLATDATQSAVFAIDLANGSLGVVAGDPGIEGTRDGIGTDARLRKDLVVVGDGGSQAWIADLWSSTIRALDLSSATLTTLAGSSLLAASGTANGAFADARFETPRQLAVDPLGHIVVGDGAAIRSLDLQAKTVTATATAPYFAVGLAYTPDGTLYFADAIAAIYTQPAGASAATAVFGSPQMQGDVDGIGTNARFTCAGPLAYVAGTLVMADCVAGTVRLLDLASGQVTTIAGSAPVGETDGTGLAAHFHVPYGIATDGVRTVWIADYSGCTIRQLDLVTHEVTTLAGTGGTDGYLDGVGAAARFLDPYALAYDGHGSLYVAEWGNYAVRRIWVATGAVSTVVGTPARHGIALGSVAGASLDQVFGVAVAPSGDLVLTSAAAVLAVEGP